MQQKQLQHKPSLGYALDFSSDLTDWVQVHWRPVFILQISERTDCPNYELEMGQKYSAECVARFGSSACDYLAELPTWNHQTPLPVLDGSSRMSNCWIPLEKLL